MHVERIRYLLARHREGELQFPARAEGAGRRFREWDYRSCEGSDRLVGGVARGLQELKGANEGDDARGEPDDSSSVALANWEIIGKLELFARRMIPSLSYYSGLQAVFLIDVNRGPDRDHRIQPLDVLVTHSDAAVAH